MNKKSDLYIALWSEKTQALIDKIKKLLSAIGIDETCISTEVFKKDKPISIVFAGQYSAGKSTMLKALTGIQNIETGSGITTQKTHTYDWNGINVVDTPGIHTKLRPDHDEVSYKAIAEADMLAYVVTQELFDDFIGSNFRKLLLDKDKAGEMILIVNKMADIGNTPENREIKLKDLEKVTLPYTPAQLHTVFIDAESYLESLTESDKEIAEELYQRSNYKELINTLNNFVQEKSIPSRLTTILYKLFDFLQKLLEKYNYTSGDTDIDALEEHLLQERHILSNTQWRINSAVRSLIEQNVSNIREIGRDMAKIKLMNLNRKMTLTMLLQMLIIGLIRSMMIA